MARPQHLFVFCYDIERDSTRVKLADALSEYLVRVQKSVFEGRMELAVARGLAARTARFIGPKDSLRVYCITDTGRKLSEVHGVGALAEAGDFWLL